MKTSVFGYEGALRISLEIVSPSVLLGLQPLCGSNQLWCKTC
jgi:hypothetical protein